jgi:hypothetical protein
VKIYIATIVDRHVEPYSEAFKEFVDAWVWVRKEIDDQWDYVDDNEMTEREVELAKWEWHKAYSCEGDFVYIRESVLK